VQLTNFCLKIYFPAWFNIKKENKITDGAKHFFKRIERVRQFPTDKVREISMKVLQRNAYFAHSENVILGMLAEDDENIRRRAVDKPLELRSEASATTDMESFTLESSRKDVVRQFKVPKINGEATHFYELTNLDSIKDISHPSAVMDLYDTSIAQMLTKPLVLQHPCHNQAVERHDKLVTEAASVVTGYEKRDGMIRQKIQSRLLMSKFDSKQQFV